MFAGLLRLFDVATRLGLVEHHEDFGQTFAVWGVASGPYLMVPFWGPVTVRDAVGDLLDTLTYPTFYIKDVALRNGLIAGWALDRRAAVLDAESLISGDRYLFVRDAVLQRREYLILDGEVAGLLVGVLVSIFQTVTSIQDNVLAFMPRAGAIFVVFALTFPWMLRTVIGFSTQLIGRLPELIR